MGVSNNQSGAEGNKFEFIAKNKVTTIGMSCPNIGPSIRTDNHGSAYVKPVLSKYMGSVPIVGSLPSSSVIDASINHPHGSWSLYIGNKWNVGVGSGGISIKTTGTSNFKSPKINLVGENDVNVDGGSVVQIKSGKVVSINAKLLVVSKAQSVFNGNITTTSNLVVNGGLFVRGETFLSHVTMQGVNMHTKESAPITAYLNPVQSFAVKNGSSQFAKLNLFSAFSSGLSSMSGSLPNTPGYIDILIAIPLPSPIDSVINVPGRIAFPSGVQFISDGFYKMCPEQATLAWTNPIPLPSFEQSIPDITSSTGHTHEFKGPAITYKKDTGEFYEAAASSGVDGSKPIGHEPGVPGGLSQLSEWTNQYIDNAKQSVVDAGTNLLKNMGWPF